MSLEIKNLTAGYGDIVVLRDVSFTVPQDQIVSLLGANGAGKTTSLNAICGLLADVKSGSILLDGKPVFDIYSRQYGISPRYIAASVFY
jgi:branched-chain amino acid transport system ATP-binding protein